MIYSSYKKKVFQNAGKVAHLTIQIGESDILREKSKEVNVKSEKIKKTISDLKETLNEYKKLTGKGRGIAAVQIGISLKIAVINISGDLVAIINPKIVGQSKDLYEYPEMCMSANPIIAKVVRPGWVKVEYLDESGNPQLWDNKKDLIINRVFQHEIDHMEGIINIDLVDSKNLILDSDPKYLKRARFKKIK